MRIPALPIVLAPLLLAGCELFHDDPEPDGRIVFGERIDGVRIGDDSLEVVQKLGVPSRVESDWAGNPIWRYTGGDHAGLAVTLSRDSTGAHVTRVSTHAPYSGESQDGIGIGSRRDRVLRAWSEPDRANDLDSLRYDLYFLDELFVGVEYREGKAVVIEMERLVEDPEIVWGESIEGIRIGDDSLSVIEKLGEPTLVGVEPPGSSLFYHEGRLASTVVVTWTGIGVIQVSVGPQDPGFPSHYSGKTREGVCLGMRRGEVLRRLGVPAKSDTGTVILDDYQFDDLTVFSLYYDQNILENISMKYGLLR